MVGPPPGGIALNGVLAHLRGRLAVWFVLRGVLLLVTAMAAAVLVLGAADAAFDLPEEGRAAAPWFLATCGLVILVATVAPVARWGEWRLACQFERNDPALGNALTNAVQLDSLATVSPVTEALRQAAVERGRTVAQRLPILPIVRTSLWRAVGATAITAASWLLVVTVFGPILQVVWPRFADPRGDHPPFSRLQFAVSPGAAQVIYGGQLEIHVTATGAPAGELFVATRASSSELLTPMFRAPDGSFFQTLANLREPIEYFVTDRHARSKRFAIGVRYTPQINAVELEAVFPSYTGLPSRSQRLGDAEVRLPVGTRVNLRAFSNRPLRDGTLALTPVLSGKEQTITLTNGATATTVTGAFELNEPVAFRIDVRDVDGYSSQEPRQGRFGVIPDQRPQIFVLEPERRAVATPDTLVPVHVQARDDYAVSRVLWFRALNRSIERPVSMPLTMQGGPRAVEATGVLDLGRLGVRPGDQIEFYFEAVDNDPRGPNLATSAMHTLQIISQEQYQEILRRMALQRQALAPYDALDNWLRRLAERARALMKKPDATDATALADEIGKLRDQAKQALAMPVYLDVEEFLRNSIREQDRPLENVQQDFARMGRTGQLTPGDLAYDADKLAALAAKEHVEVGEPFVQLLSIARVLAKADVFARIAQQQTELVRLLRRFEDRSDPLSRLEQREIQDAALSERDVEKEFNDLMAVLPELLAQVPAEEQFNKLRDQVNAFLQAATSAEISKDLGEAMDRLDQIDAPAGIAAANQALDKILKLVAQCDENAELGKQCLNFQPTLREHMGNSLEQLIAALGGNGMDGNGDGYSLFNQNVALYGPNAPPPAREAAEGSGPETGGAGSGNRGTADNGETDTTVPAVKGRIELQRDVRFPLQYREIVGEYFKAIAEEE
jgi:uncharacterized protein YjiS (DUF1127 family)